MYVGSTVGEGGMEKYGRAGGRSKSTVFGRLQNFNEAKTSLVWFVEQHFPRILLFVLEQ